QVEEWLIRQQARKADAAAGGGGGGGAKAAADKQIPPPGSIRWHMIGHLQRNKVRPLMNLCQVIHSVDSLRLAEEIHEEAERTAAAASAPAAAAAPAPAKPMEILLEVNVAGEGSKFGVAVGAALH